MGFLFLLHCFLFVFANLKVLLSIKTLTNKAALVKASLARLFTYTEIYNWCSTGMASGVEAWRDAYNCRPASVENVWVLRAKGPKAATASYALVLNLHCFPPANERCKERTCECESMMELRYKVRYWSTMQKWRYSRSNKNIFYSIFFSPSKWLWLIKIF